MPIKESYSLPLESLPSLSFEYHLDDLLELQCLLESRGIPTRNTRIQRYIDYLTHVIKHGAEGAETTFKNSIDDRFQHSTDWMLYVLREVHELIWILKGLRIRMPLGIDQKLKYIVEGRDFAGLDTDSRSRDIQFELRIASYFCQLSLEVDLLTPTDVVVLTDKQAFYIECKRVGKKSQLQKRLSEANKQLMSRMPKKHGKRVVFGCVAMDVTKVAFSHNGLTWAVTQEHAKDIIQQKLIEVAGSIHNLSLIQNLGTPHACWIQIHIPALVQHPPSLTTRFSSYHLVNEISDRKKFKAQKVFYEIFEAASKAKDVREMP